MVQAAVVHTWGLPPTYEPISLPPPTQTQHRIAVLAAALHTLVRSRAAGRHYTTSTTSPPHIPGTDGVGRILPSGPLVYFTTFTSLTGSFASEINVEKEDIFELPAGADEDAIVLLANGVASAWMALTCRAGIKPGNGRLSVAVLGATGFSGQAAVQVARAMGVERVVAIGRPGEKLEKTRELGATDVVELSEVGEMNATAAADVDVVLDYLWGGVAMVVLKGMLEKRRDKSQKLTWVEIGTLGGDELLVSGAMLRKANTAFLGCGPGSWTYDELRAQLPAMLGAMVDSQIKAEHQVERLSDVGKWWNDKAGTRKLVKP